MGGCEFEFKDTFLQPPVFHGVVEGVRCYVDAQPPECEGQSDGDAKADGCFDDGHVSEVHASPLHLRSLLTMFHITPQCRQITGLMITRFSLSR